MRMIFWTQTLQNVCLCSVKEAYCCSYASKCKPTFMDILTLTSTSQKHLSSTILVYIRYNKVIVSLTRQSSCDTGLLFPGWLMSHTLTQPFPPVYTCRVGLLMVTAHTTSPWFSVLIWRACRGIPGPTSASGGNGTGCICPSAATWKEYALITQRGKVRQAWAHVRGQYRNKLKQIRTGMDTVQSVRHIRCWGTLNM